VLGIGGFGIVYLAFDHALEREVAVKEYMPASLAGRTETLHVTVRSQSDADTFALGLRSFVNEARLLARFDHPSLLKVLRFWEANGTAYMAMPVLRGRTLRDVRMSLSEAPTEGWVRALVEPLLGAIETLHAAGVYHRDIAPDNIQIEPDGRPVLLDFGAARRVLSDKTQTLTAILKPAYAPIEQYAESGAVKQGPWTDIYAFGATLHFVLLARPPAPATTRAVHDGESALTAQALPDISEELMRTVEWMIAPRPQDRPQSVADLREVLSGRASAPRRRVVQAPADSGWDATVRVTGSGATAPRSALTRDPVDSTLLATMKVSRPQEGSQAPPPQPPAAGSARPRPGWLLPAAGLATAAVVAAGFFLWPRHTEPAPAALAASAPAATVAETALPPASAPPVTTPAVADAKPAATPQPPVAESTVATVSVPGPAVAAHPGVSGPARPVTTARRPPALATAVPAAAGAQTTPPAETPTQRPEPPPAPVVAAAQATPAPEPTGPEAECRKIPKHQLVYVTCMTRLCRTHPTLADCQAFYRNAHAD
jgi:serine/threonine protein kinase